MPNVKRSSISTLSAREFITSQQHIAGALKRSSCHEPSYHLPQFSRDVRAPSIPPKHRRNPCGQLILVDRVNLLNEPNDRFLQFRRRNLVDRSDRVWIRLVAGPHHRRRLTRKGEKTIRLRYNFAPSANCSKSCVEGATCATPSPIQSPLLSYALQYYFGCDGTLATHDLQNHPLEIALSGPFVNCCISARAPRRYDFVRNDPDRSFA